MPRTADSHDHIADARLPKTVRGVDEATALHATIDVLEAHATAGNTPVGGFLRAREFPAPRLLRRHEHLDVRPRERQDAQIREEPAARGQGGGRGSRHPLLVGAAGVGLPEKEHGQRGSEQQDVLPRVARFLAAIIARLLSRILGPSEAPCGPLMSKRGEAGAGAGGSARVNGPGGGTPIARASASVTPRRWANAVKARVGASPKARRGAGSPTTRT
jgi:hypothetical protein